MTSGNMNLILIISILLVFSCSGNSETVDVGEDNLADLDKIEAPDEIVYPSEKTNLPQVDRLIVVGDVHGDLTALKRALYKAGAIDEDLEWVGGKLVIVQIGDILDRGDNDFEVINLFEKLKKDAKKNGGVIHTLSGNHELMNVQLDFRYVTDLSTERFEESTGLTREEAFKPGGEYARLLAEFPVVIKIGKIIFVHGGIVPEQVKYGIDRLNYELSSWMKGDPDDLSNHLKGEQGLVWRRDYSEDTDEEDCEKLYETLELLDAEMMIVGHTVQDNINSECNGHVWRVDTGMSWYYGGVTEVLEIKNGEINVLSL